MTNLLMSRSEADGVTFDLADVEPAAEALPTVKTHKAAQSLIGGVIEACSDYTADCCEDITTNPLVTAVQLAYNQHRPLILSPDMIWLTILQGVSAHVEQHADELSIKLLRNPDERRAVLVSTSDLPPGSPENPWGDLINESATDVESILTPRAASLYSLQFSTSTQADRIAKNLAMLSGMRKFMSFLDGWAICGIPSLTLEGRPDDWEQLRRSLDLLDDLGLDWWLKRLRPRCAEFVRAAEGKPNLDHWSRIYTATEAMCGNEWVSGWIADFFPYMKRCAIGLPRNPSYEKGSGLDPILTDLPSGLAEVPFRCRRGTIMRLLGGFLGIEQKADSLALRPRIGWAVRRQTSFEALLDRVAESDRCQFASGAFEGSPLLSTPKLKQFFARFDGLEVRSTEGRLLCEFESIEEVHEVCRQQPGSDLRPLIFNCFARLPDGRSLGCRSIYSEADERFAFFLADQRVLEPQGQCQLISNDFEQVLTWIMECEDGTLDKAPSFHPIATVDPRDEAIYDLLAPLGRPD